MTSLNAAKVGLFDRGLLRRGLFADVTVFDPQSRDRSIHLPRAVPVQRGHRHRTWSSTARLVLEERQRPTGRPARPWRTAARRLIAKAKRKNRPENGIRTTTSPLVVQNPADWPVRRESPERSSHASGLLYEKGRAGGRARQPARPVAVSRSRVFETAVASGVDSCEVGLVGSCCFPLSFTRLLRCIAAS